ncbi:hypothetical protein GCM10010532_095150 [Dactylosporangium siamense]|uniref:Uncharacterized protein n=1 Tax=Dactylosporangium siamense TaxID=685454 RepID=A0A919PY47_9ACTN|nr:hypothetical protein Dsi01nite_085210 [Dactylosporangium siamense]
MLCGFLIPVLSGSGAFWHHRGVPPTPPSAEDHGARPPAADQAARRRRREEADPVDVSDEWEVPGRSESWPPVRRLVSLGIAGFAALLTVGLVVGAQTRHESYAVVIFGVQVLFVAVWVVASRPPAPRVVAAVGIAVAIGTDVAAVLTRPASLAPLAYVTAAGFIVGVVGQLTRPAGRQRVTESLGSSLVVTLGVVAFASVVVLSREVRGTQAIVACIAAAGIAILVARITDAVVALPRIAPQVPRGGAGVVLGAMVGTAAAGAIGNLLDGITPLWSALAGLATAIVALMVDLSVGYAEASRRIDGDEPALYLARHIQGPMGAFAFAAPAAYVASVLLLL